MDWIALLYLLVHLHVTMVLMESQKLEIIFGGDISFAGLSYFLKKNHTCSYNTSFMKIKDRLKADFKVANLESPFGDISKLPNKTDKGKPVHLLAEPESVEALRYLGVDVVSVANNHFADFGEESMKLTLAELWKNNIKVSGYNFGKKNQSDQEPIILSHNGVTVGILSYCAVDDGCYIVRDKVYTGPDVFERKKAVKAAKDLQKVVNIVVVFLHWGEELTVMETNEQFSIAKVLHPYVNAIIGSHSHAPGEHYYVNETLVIQSLGNFLYPMRNTKHIDFQIGNEGGSKKKLKSIKKMMKKFNNPTTIAEVIKLTFDRNGVIAKESMFAHFDITMDENKCLVVEENKQKSPWKLICGDEDRKCSGDSSCNALQCAKNSRKGKNPGNTNL